jgi:3-hydroxybutyryl-CoA dehydrogenase
MAMSLEIRHVGVLGAGTMGNGIAQAFAAAGFPVTMRDIKPEYVDRGMATIARSLERLTARGKLPAEAREATLGRIRPTTEIKDLASCDLVVEAVLESYDLKAGIIHELDVVCGETAIFATNTSSISVTQIAAASCRPDRVVGMHFFNPVPMMALVELIRGFETDDATVKATSDLAKRLGKTPIVVKNSPGFVVNRILCPMINEAVLALQEGLASAKEIDDGMKLGCSHPIGPLALADMVGLDVLLAVMEVFYRDFSDPKYRPALLLQEMVAAGHLGRKSGRGFYTYA